MLISYKTTPCNQMLLHLFVPQELNPAEMQAIFCPGWVGATQVTPFVGSDPGPTPTHFFTFPELPRHLRSAGH